MTINNRLPLFARLTQQPIAQAELNHQNRTVSRPRRRWRRWLERAFIAFIYITAFVLLGNEMLGFLFISSGRRGTDYRGLTQEWLAALTVIAVATTVIIHFRRMLQTLSLSANSIARERGTINWDTLVLTGIDAAKIVRGKWWATVRHMWRPYVMLGILRAAFVILYGANTNRTYYSYAFYNGTVSNTGAIIPMLLQLILAGVVVFSLTMANLLFTAACGVTAFNKRSSIALARAIGTRLLLILGLGLLSFFLFRVWVNYSYSDILPSIIALGLLTLVDNGVIVGGQITFYNTYTYGSNINPTFGIYLPATIAALLFYMLLTFLMLRFARWQAVRNNALPPIKRKFIEIV